MASIVGSDTLAPPIALPPSAGRLLAVQRLLPDVLARHAQPWDW
ncbi:hypothetical protein [Streptomyces sp. DSM 40907]|nr:hypothetical protein [Streptomyces sp. DSM 40907]